VARSSATGSTLRVFFLIDDFQVALAGIAGFGADGTLATFDFVQGDFLVGVAGRAGGARHVPFGIAQRAVQVAQVVDGGAEADDAGDRQAAAAGADAMGVEFLQMAGFELAGQLGENDLQGGGDEGQCSAACSAMSGVRP
jgi:hypothetical protein